MVLFIVYFRVLLLNFVVIIYTSWQFNNVHIQFAVFCCLASFSIINKFFITTLCKGALFHLIWQHGWLWAGQCFGGTTAFEKTVGYTFDETSQPLLRETGSSITNDCNGLCKNSPLCQSFTVGKQTLARSARTFPSASPSLSVSTLWLALQEQPPLPVLHCR